MKLSLVITGLSLVAPAAAQTQQDDVSIVVIGDASLQAQVNAEVASSLQARGLRVDPGALDAAAINTVSDCFVLEDPSCAAGVLKTRARTKHAVVVTFQATPRPDGTREVILATHWFTGGEHRHDTRTCSPCTDDKLHSAIGDLVVALAPATAALPPSPVETPAVTTDAVVVEDEPKPIGVIVGAKLGGIVPIDGLSPFVSGGIEVGYALAEGRIAVIAAMDYTQPTTTQSESDPRVSGGMYSWQLTEQELGVMVTAVYRLTAMRPVVPYAGIGPRVVFLRSTVQDNGAPTFMKTTEQSTGIGIGVPIGAELHAGPGSLTGELLLQYGSLDHVATGESHTGALSLSVGYRMIF